MKNFIKWDEFSSDKINYFIYSRNLLTCSTRSLDPKLLTCNLVPIKEIKNYTYKTIIDYSKFLTFDRYMIKSICDELKCNEFKYDHEGVYINDSI